METLLLLHGAIGASDQFKPLKEKMEANYHTHLLDFSGHGSLASMNTPFSIQLFCEDVLKWMSTNGEQRINIFGYSMGGYVALYFAANYPEKVNKVFTLATKFDWNKETALRESKMLDPEKIKEKVPHFADQLEKRHGRYWKEVLHKTADMMVDLGNSPALSDELFKKITCPVTIAVGDKDTMVTLEETINTYRRISNASLLVMPDVAHPIEKVPEDRLVVKLKRFFDKLV